MTEELTLCFRHPDFIVINKPAGVSVHKDEQAVGLTEKIAKQLGVPQVWLVHRLDKITSGLLILALNKTAAVQFYHLFEQHQIEKTYWALSDKKPKKKQGKIVGDMEKSRSGAWKLCHSKTNPAITQFVSHSLEPHLRHFILQPKTGKTHQLRAQDTANYILAENADQMIPHFHHEGLNEIDFGSWEGMKSVDLYENDEYWTMKKTPIDYKAEGNGGETYEQLYQRAFTVFQQIAKLHKDNENVLIVAHGMTLTVLTAVLRGLHWSECRDETKHSFVMNTAINLAQVENGEAKLVEFNNVAHLA